MNSDLSEVFLSQVHDFLGGTCTLDGGVGEGEDGVPVLCVSDGGKCLLHSPRGVVRDDLGVILQGFQCPWDLHNKRF